MDTKHLITLISSIIQTVSSKHTHLWDTLHYTHTDWEKGGNLHSNKLYTVKFSTTHLVYSTTHFMYITALAKNTTC